MGKSKDLATGASYVDTSGDTMTGALGIGGVSKTTALSSAAHFDTLGLIVDDNTAYDNVGVGGGIAFRAKRNSSGTQTVFGAIDVGKESAANDSYTGSLRFYTNNNSTGIPTKHMNIDALGRVTIPNQPRFRAHKTVNVELTSETTIVYNATTSNVGSHYNTSNGQFTAPVAGLYRFQAMHYHYSTTGGEVRLQLFKNGSLQQNVRHSRSAARSFYDRIVLIEEVELAANDYVYVTGQGSSGGQLHTSNGLGYADFYGHLIG